MPRDASAQKSRPAESRTDPSPMRGSPSPSANQMESLTVLLTEQGLIEYESEIRAKGITEPHHLLRLTPAVIEAIIPDKPIHQRKLAALSRGRNLNAATFSMEAANPNAKKPPPGPGGAVPFRSKSADDVLPEKPGLRNATATNMPDLATHLEEAINVKFGEEFNQTVVKYLKLQGVVDPSDLKHCDMLVLIEQVKDAGAKPIQLGKLKDWVQTAAVTMPTVAETAAETPPAAEDHSSKKKSKPPPKRSESRASSANDVAKDEADMDPLEAALVKRFGKFYGETVQSFLMTQGVLDEDDLMVRDHLKMLATAKVVGVKPVQLSKLKEWMLELKELGDGPVRPILPHERQGSKLKLTKQVSQSGKDYDASVRAARQSKDADMAL